jgi:outer membrane protein assembly factor BamC
MSFKAISATTVRLSFIAVSVALCACSVTDALTESSKIDYRSAKKGPGLDIPPDLVSPKSDDRYRVPEPSGDRTLSGFQRGQGTTPVQGGPSVLPAVEGVRMERSGTQRWLVVNRPPESVWPMLRTFWTEAGFAPAVESSETGIYETDWAENRAKIPRDGIRKALGKVFDGLYDSGQRDKFRTRIERSKEGTEIYLTHRGMEEVYANTQTKDRTIWVPRAADPELEAEFLRRLMTRFGVGKEAVAAALPDSTPSAVSNKPEKAVIQGQGADQKLNISEGFDQAWRQLSLALDRGGFTVDDRDRSKGQFFVRYVDPETQAKLSEKPGFFSRVFGGSGSKLDQTERFQLNVVRSGEQQTLVEVRDGKGGAVPEGDRPTVEKILGLLRSQIN